MSIVSNHFPEIIEEMNDGQSPEDWQDYQRYLDSPPDLREPEPDEAA